MSDLGAAIDEVLDAAVTASPGMAGVAAVVTDRDRTVYEGARGERELGGGEPFGTDTVVALFSTTKAIGATACLQLVDDGLLDLDAPARDYLPRIANLQVLDGFDDDGAPRLRPPRRDVTTRQLLTHTAGLAYPFCNEAYARLTREHGQATATGATWAGIETPLLFDPGDDWEYGSNIDWAGMVVEAITGRRLGDVLEDRVFAPLGMTSTGFTITPAMRSRLATIHARQDDGGLAPMVGFELPQDPELHMAGHGVYSTAQDYARFIAMWLADGVAPSGERVLRAETVAMASTNHLPPGMRIKALPGVERATSNDAEFFPGMPKTWGLSFMINEQDAPSGRPAGSLSWAGLANLYYWIDRRNGVGGIWVTQLFPFFDATAVASFTAFETAVYAHPPSP